MLLQSVYFCIQICSRQKTHLAYTRSGIMSVIRTAEFKFNLLKPSAYLISISRSIRTDSCHFPHKNKCLLFDSLWNEVSLALKEGCSLIQFLHVMVCQAFCSLKFLGPNGFTCRIKCKIRWYQTDLCQCSTASLHYFVVPLKLGNILNLA